MVLDHLADGSVTLTTVRLLAPHLTDANHATLLTEASRRSKREVEHIVARLHPQPDVPASVRKLPVPALPQQPAAASATLAGELAVEHTASATPASHQSEPPPVPPSVASPPSPRPAVVAPIAPARYKISFTVGADTYAKLRQIQDLLRHAVPNGDPAEIYDRALTVLLTQLMNTKEVKRNHSNGQQAAKATPHNEGRPGGGTPRSRRIPVDVQRAVWQRDGGQCTFVCRTGRRCTARAWLEFHHTVPFAVGGEATVENVRLLCRAHNQQQATRDFGLRDARCVREAPPAYGATRSDSCRHEFVWGEYLISLVRVNLRSRPAWRSTNPVAFLEPSMEKMSSTATAIRTARQRWGRHR